MTKKAPEKIYVNLDTYEGNGGEWLDFRDFDNDVEYIRKDLYDLLLEKCKRIEKETDILLGVMESINK